MSGFVRCTAFGRQPGVIDRRFVSLDSSAFGVFQSVADASDSRILVIANKIEREL